MNKENLKFTSDVQKDAFFSSSEEAEAFYLFFLELVKNKKYDPQLKLEKHHVLHKERRQMYGWSIIDMVIRSEAEEV